MAPAQNQQSSFVDPSACTFPLGGDVFLSCNVFMDKTLVHVRLHKNFGNKYYPTKEGITLTQHQFMVLTGSNSLKAKSTDHDNPLREFFIDMPPQLDPITVYSETTAGIRDHHVNNEILITFSSDSVALERVYTSKSGFKYSTTVTLDDQQWSNIFTQSELLLTAMNDLQLCRVQFKELFEMISGHSAPTAAPGDDIAYFNLSVMLQAEISKAISEYPGMYNSLTNKVPESPLHSFNTALMDLNLYDVMRNFYTAVSNAPKYEFLKKKPIKCVTAEFLESVNIHEIIQNIRHEFCKN